MARGLGRFLAGLDRGQDLLAELLRLAHHVGLGRDDHDHAPAFHVGRDLDGRQIRRRLDHAVEDVHAGLRVRDLAAAEHDREPDLVAALEEAADMLHLEVHVVPFRLGTELDLLDLDGRRVLAGLLLLLGLLVLVLAVVHDAADRREGARRDLDEIQPLLLGQAQRLMGGHDARLRLFVDDDPHLGNPDAVVDAEPTLGPAPIVSAHRTAVHGRTLLGCIWVVVILGSR